MVISLILDAIILVYNVIERELLFNVAISVDHNKIQKMPFTSVDTYHVSVFCLLKIFLNLIVEVYPIRTFEVHRDWNMEHKFVECIALVFDQVIIKDTLGFGIVFVLVLDWFMRRMCRLLPFQTLLTIE